MANTIREDVVSVSFDIDLKELTKLSGDIDELKKKLTGGIGDDAFDDLKKSANGSVTPLNKVKQAVDKVGDKLTTIGKKAATVAFNGLKKVASISFKALTVGITGAATAIGGLIAKSVSAYADYEQLVGGVETLFKDNAGTVQKYANQAYKTAGLFANAYMDTVTSFSASLIASCGGDTAKAADLANTALVDMSDNANKMGTDMGSLQYAYQGFAKQNYTMLDNLKLGYGGTKTEMQRLIKDAAKLDKSVDANSMSFGNIVKAIHAVQENMGILGTTQKEADKTITGSLNSMKAAWGNLLPALLKGGDEFEQCVDNLVDSAVTFGDNIMPAIEKAMSGVGTLIEKLAPKIAEVLPGLVQKVLPSLAKAGTQIIISLGQSLVASAPALVQAAKEIIVEVVKALYEGFTGQPMGEDKLNSLKQTLDKVFSGIQTLVEGAISALQKLWPVIEFVGGIALSVFGFVADNAEWLLPLILGIAAAFKAYKITMSAINAVTKAYTTVQTLLSKCSTTLAAKLPAVAAGTKATGTASATSATQVSTAATAFMKMGVGVLAIGAGILLAAAGFWILAQAAIALANAGWGAIAVMIGLVAAIAALAWGASMLGAALTAGAVGFIAFGAAVLLVGAGFALLGAGAWLSAMALSIIVSVLPSLVTYGLQGALAITALGAGLMVFAVGALLAGVAAIVLGAGLLVVTVALLALTVAIAALLVVFTLMNVLITMFNLQMMLLPVWLMMNTMLLMMFTLQLTMLTLTITLLTPLLLMFTASLLAMTVVMMTMVVTITLVSALMLVLMASMLILTPAAALLKGSIVAIGNAFAKMGTAMPIIVARMGALAGLFLAVLVPAKALDGPIEDVGEAFADFAHSAAKAVPVAKLLLTAFKGLATAVTTCNTQLKTMPALFAAALSAMLAFSATAPIRFSDAMGKLARCVATGGVKMIKTMQQVMLLIVIVVRKTNLVSAGMFMMNGLILGMNSRRKAAISTARSIAQAINREYAKVQKIKSPSRVWSDFGGYQIQGDINGMKKKMPQLKATVQEAGEFAMPYAGKYTPEGSASTYNSSRKTEYNSYSPQFNFSASGTTDDRAMLRKMKRMFAEAWEEMLSGYESKMPRTQEV